MNRCGDIAIRKFSNESSVGLQYKILTVLTQYIVIDTFSLCYRNVAREDVVYNYR